MYVKRCTSVLSWSNNVEFAAPFAAGSGLAVQGNCTAVTDALSVFCHVSPAYRKRMTSGTCTASLGDVMQCGRMSARYIADDVAAKRV